VGVLQAHVSRAPRHPRRGAGHVCSAPQSRRWVKREAARADHKLGGAHLRIGERWGIARPDCAPICRPNTIDFWHSVALARETHLASPMHSAASGCARHSCRSDVVAGNHGPSSTTRFSAGTRQISDEQLRCCVILHGTDRIDANPGACGGACRRGTKERRGCASSGLRERGWRAMSKKKVDAGGESSNSSVHEMSGCSDRPRARRFVRRLSVVGNMMSAR